MVSKEYGYFFEFLFVAGHLGLQRGWRSSHLTRGRPTACPPLQVVFVSDADVAYGLRYQLGKVSILLQTAVGPLGAYISRLANVNGGPLHLLFVCYLADVL